MPCVLILCEYATLNGGERSMLSTLGGIAGAGYQVRVAAPAHGPLAEALRGAGGEVVPFEPRDAQGVRLPLDVLRRNLGEILRRHRPALLHANSLAMGRLSGPVTAEWSLPSLSHLRDIVTLSRQAIADLNCHTRLLAVSQATRQYHVARGLAGEKTYVLYNGIDLEQFRPRPATGYLHQQLGLARDVPLIGTIGQISLRKGHDVLAAALANLPSPTTRFGNLEAIQKPGSTLQPDGAPACGSARNARQSARKAASSLARRASIPQWAGGEGVPFAWLIIGQRFSGKAESRQFEERLHQAAVGPLAGKVHFLGVRDDVSRILNELTFLVHSARQEPLGRVLLEAAAAGLALVATDVGGTREIFRPEDEAACLIPPGDAQAMSAAIGTLLGDPTRRLRLGENARRRVEEAFDLKRAVAGLVEQYEFAVSIAN